MGSVLGNRPTGPPPSTGIKHRVQWAAFGAEKPKTRTPLPGGTWCYTPVQPGNGILCGTSLGYKRTLVEKSDFSKEAARAV